MSSAPLPTSSTLRQAGWPCWAKGHYRAAQALQGLGMHVAAVRALGAAARLEPGGWAGGLRPGRGKPFQGLPGPAKCGYAIYGIV